MKILQLLAGAPHGGAETAFVDMCIALHEAGEDIEVATRPNDLRVGQMRSAGLTVHELPFGGSLDLYTPFKLKKIINRFQPEIVQTWMSRASHKIPNLSAIAGDHRPIAVARLGGYYKLKYFKKIDYFVTITPDIGRHLQDHGIAASRITHINNFAETETVDRPLNRADLDTPEDKPVLLTLARLHKNKALDVLLEALTAIPDAYLWIAGEGPERDALTTQCHDLGLDNRVRFLGWRDDRAALLQRADICVFPSRWEPFGTVFVQAWAQNTPLVTSKSDGPRQFVRHEEDGLIVPIDDAKALAEAVNQVIQDPDLAAKMVENGQKRYQDEFTKEQTVKAYLDYYRSLLQESAQKTGT